MANDSRQSLERRLAELSDEIRHYPTPIARCDEQLAELLERRSRVLAELRAAQDRQPAASGCTPEGIWINDGGFDAA
jgi:chromosome segregation ATPase